MFHNTMCVNSGIVAEIGNRIDYLCVLYLLVHIAHPTLS